MSYQEILYAIDNGVATITLNRPDKLNAITPLLFDEMRAALHAADADDAARVIVITGAGKGFCAGADVGRLDGLLAARRLPRPRWATTRWCVPISRSATPSFPR